MLLIKPFILFSLFLTIVGCSSSYEQSKNSLPNENKKTTEKHFVTTNIPSSQTEFRETHISCLDSIEFLRKINKYKYAPLFSSYYKIMDERSFLMTNNSIIDKDSRVYLSNNLTIKLDTLCSKIQYEAFQVVKEKTKALTDI